MIDLDPFVAFRVETIPPEVVDWRGRETFARDYRDELAEIVRERTQDAEWTKRYAEHCPIEGALPADYQLRHLDLGRDGEVLAGIHFVGCQVKSPFVGVEARSKSFEDARQVARMTAQLIGAFERFKPPRVRFFQNVEAAEFPLESIPASQGDGWLVAGQVEALRKRPHPAGMERISLVEAPAMDFWDEYEAMFKRFHAERPEFAERVTITERKMMEDCAATGELFRVFVDGEWAGVIAGLPCAEFGLRGHLVCEEILDTEYRGRRLGPALQRHVVDRLKPAEGGLLFGTIDFENTPSIRTALGVGRVKLGHWTFVSTSGS